MQHQGLPLTFLRQIENVTEPLALKLSEKISRVDHGH